MDNTIFDSMAVFIYDIKDDPIITIDEINQELLHLVGLGDYDVQCHYSKSIIKKELVDQFEHLSNSLSYFINKLNPISLMDKYIIMSKICDHFNIEVE